MGIVKFSMWLNIPSKHCGYIFRKINWHILSGFFPLFFGISLAVVKTDMKFLLKSLFFVFDLCHICLLSASWVLF